MAQNIILKRSANPGKVPTTSSLDLGEVAINTYDGRVYLKKSGSVESVEHLITTNSETTGSITIIGTGSFSELVVNQDVNVQKDLFVVRDIINNGDIDASGSISGSGLMVNDTLNVNHLTFQMSGSSGFTGSLDVIGELSASTFNGLGNLTDYSQSITNRINSTNSSIDSINTFTSSQETLNSTFATTGSNTFVGSQIVTGSIGVTENLTVLGEINARQFNINIISSSTIFESGSSKFGDTIDDTHQFTGSVSITGSFLVNGTEVGVANGPNTFDFNLDPEAAGTVNFIEDSTSNTQAIATTSSFDVKVSGSTYVSIGENTMNVTTGSITANYMHLAKYISNSGDLDFNI